MTAPQQRAGGLDANARGIGVLVVTVIIGLLLLLNTGGDDGASAVSSGAGGGATTTEPSGSSTTTTPDDTTTTTEASTGGHQAAEVKVLVLNGSGLAGVAKTNSDAIGAKGYEMLAAANATANVEDTVVYFADGYEADAAAVADALGKTSDAVEAMPDTPPGAGADQANVVVVLGSKDTAPAT
jgi:hypothetical protein